MALLSHLLAAVAKTSLVNLSYFICVFSYLDIFVQALITQPPIRAFRALISGYSGQQGLKRGFSGEFSGVDHGSDGAIAFSCPH